MANLYSLFIVGKGGRGHSPLTTGMSDQEECPELGTVGDLLASSDFDVSGSVLVVQQHRPSNHDDDDKFLSQYSNASAFGLAYICPDRSLLYRERRKFMLKICIINEIKREKTKFFQYFFYVYMDQRKHFFFCEIWLLVWRNVQDRIVLMHAQLFKKRICGFENRMRHVTHF